MLAEAGGSRGWGAAEAGGSGQCPKIAFLLGCRSGKFGPQKGYESCDVPDPAVQLSPVGEREMRRCDGLYWLKSRGVLPLTSQTGMTLHTVTDNSQSGNTVGLVPPPRTNHVSRAAGRGTAVTARGGRSHPAGRPGPRRDGGARCRAGWARSQHLPPLRDCWGSSS